MYEVEVKVEADHAAVRARLADLDATNLGVVTQVDTYFDAPHRDFAESEEALRLRRESVVDGPDGPDGQGVVEDDDGTGGADDGAGGADDGADDRPQTTTITYKGPLVDEESKSRREAETTVGNADDMRAVLAGLGFEPAATVRKERRRFAYEGYTVCLDEVEGLGQFVEVERKAESVGQARDGAYSVLEDLGLYPADGIRTSYLGLLLESDDEATGVADE